MTATAALYGLRVLAPGKFQMAKFDPDFNVETVYEVVAKGHGYTCNCPAGDRNKLKPCKHQRMMPFMLGAVNLPRFFNPDTGQWHGLLEVAPGEAASAGEPPMPENTELRQGRSDRTPATKSSDNARSEESQNPKEPASAGPEAEGAAVLPPQSQETQRPLAPAASPPSSMPVVRRRI